MWLFFLGVVLFVAIGAISSASKKARLKKLEDEAEAFLQSALTAKHFQPIPVAAMLKGSEEGYYQEERSVLFEPRAVRHYSGGGTSVRVMKGVSVRSSTGQATSTQEWKQLDQGRLIVTNKRIIFAGEKEHRSLDVGKIDAATLFTDGIRISMSNKSKPLSFTVSNPWLLAGILGVLQDPTKYFG